MSLPSFEDLPSVPSATFTPCASSSGSGQMPEPSFMFETGLCTTVTPRSRTSSMSPGVSQIPCSKQTRGERKPIASMCSGSVRPYKRCPDTACIRVSSTWMWITRSSSSARAARRARVEQLDPAEQCAQVDLVRRLVRGSEHRIREEHPRLERKVVPETAEPVLVRVRMRVDHPRHDGKARAVDHALV